MRNRFAYYKILLSTLSYEEQINEMNQIINELANSKKQHRYILDT